MCRLDLLRATQVRNCTSLHVEGCSLEETHMCIIRKEDREEGKEEGKQSQEGTAVRAEDLVNRPSECLEPTHSPGSNLAPHNPHMAMHACNLSSREVAERASLGLEKREGRRQSSTTWGINGHFSHCWETSTATVPCFSSWQGPPPGLQTVRTCYVLLGPLLGWECGGAGEENRLPLPLRAPNLT